MTPRSSRHTLSRASLMVAAALLGSFATSQAATLTWDSNGATSGLTDGAGSWNTSDVLWWNGTANASWSNAAIDDAVFGNANGAAGSVAIAADITVGNLTFNTASSGTYTLTGAANTGNTLTLSGAAPVITTNQSATINARIVSANGFTKAGLGTLTLNGATAGGTTNAIGGTITVNAGQFTILGTPSFSGDGAIQANITLNNRGRFRLAQDNRIGNSSLINVGADAYALFNSSDSVGALTGSGRIANTANITLTLGTADFTGVLSGSGSLTVNGAIQTLTAANLFTGTTTAIGGTLRLNHVDALRNSTLNKDTGSVAFLLAGTNAYNLGGLAGSQPLNIGANTISVGGNNASTAYSGVIGVATPTGGLTKVGTGTLTISGASIYTGATTVSRGILELQGAGSLATSGVTFNGTGGFTYTGSATGSADSVGTLARSAGHGTITSTYGTSGNTALTFTSLAARTTGATANFVISGGANGSTNRIVLTGQGANAFIDQGTFFGGDNFAWYDTGGFVRALTYGSDAGAVTSAGGASLTASSHQETTAAVTAQTDATFTTLKIAGANAFTLAAAQTLTVNGLLKTGTTATLSGGAGLRAGLNQDLVVATPTLTDALTISTPVLANGANALVKTGAGTLTMGAAAVNTYTGGTIINQGTLIVNQDNNLGSTAAANRIQLNGGTLQPGSNFTLNANHGITVNAGGGTINGNSFGLTLGSANMLSGSGPLTISGSGSTNSVITSGASQNLTGPITLNSGRLALGGANITNPFGTGEITVVSGANIYLNSGGSTWNNRLYIAGTGESNRGALRTQAGGTFNGEIILTANAIISTDGGGATTTLNGNISGAFTLTLGGSASVNSTTSRHVLTGNNVHSATVIGNGVTNINHDAALGAYNGTVTINGSGTLQAGAADIILNPERTVALFAATGSHFVDTNGFNMTIQGVVTGAATENFEKIGTGTLILSGANTYSGVTTFTGGIVNVSGLTNYGVAGPLGQRASASEATGNVGLRFMGGTLQYTGATAQSTDRQIRIGVSGGTIDASGSIPAATVTFAYSGANADLFDTAGARTLTLTGTNTGANTFTIGLQDQSTNKTSLTKTGAGTWVLAGTQTYTGVTTVSAGSLRIARTSALYNATAANWTAANIKVTGGTLALNVGGSGEFTNTDVTTLLTNLGGANGGTAGGFGNGSALGFDTTNTPGGVFTLSDLIANPTGAGAGTFGLSKTGTGTLTVSGANTYTGLTTVSAGTLQAGVAGVFTSRGGLSLAGTGVFDLNGFNAGFTTLASASTTLITNSSTSTAASNATAIGTPSGAGIYVDALTLSSADQAVAARITDGAVRETQLVINNATSATDRAGITNTANSFTGGLVLAYVSGTGTRLRITSAITGTPFGTGPIIIGQSATDKAQILLDAATGVTLANDVFVNTALGSDAPGTLRVDTAGHILTGRITANLAPVRIYSTIGTASVSLSGQVVGPLGLTVESTNVGFTTTLTGTNTYAGTTSVLGGTLRVSSDGNLGTVPASVTAGNIIINGGVLASTGTFTLSTNRGIALGGATTATGGTIDVASAQTLTYGGVIANNGGTNSFTKTGAGTLTLSGNNTYTGVTSINAGVLSVATIGNGGVAGNLGQATNAAANLVLGGGTLRYTGATASSDRSFTLTAATTSTIEVTSSTASLTLSGAAAATTGGLTMTGPGTLILTGNNTYTGVTSINAGVLSVATIGNGGVAGNLGQATNAAANLVLGGGTLRYTGATASSDRSFTLTAGTTSSIEVASAAANLTLSGVSANTTGGLTKTGPGTLILSGANAYSGNTTISAGTLQVGAGGATGSLYSPTVNTGNLTFGGAGLITNNGALVYNIAGGAVNVNRSVSGSGTVSVTGNQSVNFASGTTISTTGAQTYSASATANRYYGFTLADNGTVSLTSSGAISMTGMLGTSNTSTGRLTVDTSAGNGNVTLNTPVGISGINYGMAAVTVTAGTGTVSLGTHNGQTWQTVTTLSLTGGAVNSTANLAAFGTLTVTNSLAGTFSGTLSGGGSLTKAGLGTLTLSGANTYAGGTNINGGTVTASGTAVAGGAAALGNSVPANVVTIGSGGILTGTGNNWLDNTSLAAGGTNARTVQVNTGGILRGANGSIAGLGNLTLNGGTLEITNGLAASGWNGSFTLGGDVTVTGTTASAITSAAGSGASANLQMSNGVNTVGGTRTFRVNDVTSSAASDLVVSANLANGTVIKEGSGTLELIAGATGTGAPVTWTVNAGTLALAASGGTGRVRGVLTVNSGATVVTTGDGTGLGYTTPNKPDQIVINGGTVTTAGTMHIWNLGGGIQMTGGTLQSNQGVSTTGGNKLEWQNTAVTTLASASTATIAGQLNLRADGGTGISLNVADGAAVTDLLISAAITQSGNGAAQGLTKSGNGTLTLSGINSFTGTTTVGAGTLKLTNNLALQSSAFNTASAGTLDLTDAAINNLTIGGLIGDAVTGLNFDLPGNVTGLTLNPASEMTSSYLREITGGAAGLGLTKTGAGTQVLGGTNTYTGVTTFSAGALNVTSLNDYGVAGPLGLRASASEAFDNVGLRFLGGTLQYTGATAQSTNRQIRLGTAGGTIDASGSVPGATVTFAYSGTNTDLFDTGGTRTLTLTGTNTGANTFALGLTDQNAATGKTSLTKSGAGTWVLTGTQAYTGATTITAGTLNLATSIVGSATTINGASSVLTGLGTAGAVTLTAGTLRPGDGSATGVMNMGALTIAAGQSLGFTLGAPGTSSRVSAASLALPATGAPLRVTLTDNADAGGNGRLAHGTYNLLNYSGALTGSNAVFGRTLTVASSPLVNKSYSFANTGATNGAVTVTIAAQSPVLLQDTFDRASGLNGTTPVVAASSAAGATWTSAAGITTTARAVSFTTANSESATLPFIPQAGNVYTLSASLNAVGGTAANWLALGFANSTPPTATPNNANTLAWILQRNNNTAGRSFSGGGTGNDANHSIAVGGVEQTNTIVLDTRNGLANASLHFLVNGVAQRTAVTGFDAGAIANVVIGNNASGGTIKDLALTAGSTWLPVVATNSWDNAANWSAGYRPSAAETIAVFAPFLGTVGQTISLDADQTVGQLAFVNSTAGGGGFTVSQGAAGTLTLDNGSNGASIRSAYGDNRISAPLQLNDALTVEVASGSSVELSGAIGQTGGARGLTKNGDGILTLSGLNTYAGQTTVNAGTLRLNHAGSTHAGSVLVVNAGATLDVRSSVTVDGLSFVGATTANIGATGTSVRLLTANSLSTDPNGSVTLNIVGATPGSWASGTYPLFAYGSLTGAGFGGFQLGLVEGTTSRMLSKNLVDAGNQISLVVVNDTPKWTGAVRNEIDDAVGDWWNDGGNWKLATSLAVTDFLNGDAVIFDDTATGTTSVNIDFLVSPSAVLFDNSAKLYVLDSQTGLGIGGTSSLTKRGSGRLEIYNQNTYSGPTLIEAGTVALIGAGSSLGQSTALTLAGGSLDLGNANRTVGSLNITAAAPDGVVTLATGELTAGSYAIGNPNGNAQVSAALLESGTAGLTKSGAGTATLSGANTYLGATLVSEGTLAVTGSGTLGRNAALSLVGGRLDLGGTTQSVGAVSFLTVAAAGDTAANGSLSGASYAASNTTGSLVISANLLANGTAGFAKTGAGALILSGNNTFTGALTIAANSGMVTLSGNNTGRPAGAQGLTTVNSGATLRLVANTGNTTAGVSTALSSEQTASQPLILNSGSTLQLRADSTVTFAGANKMGGMGTATLTIDVGRLTASGSANELTIAPGGFDVSNTTFNVTGADGYALRLPSINSAAANASTYNPTTANLLLGAYSTSVTGTSTLNLGGTSSGNVVTGAITNGSGTLAVTKLNTGVWTLSGANTFTGATTVTAGTLKVGSAVAFTGTGALALSGTGVFDLNGFDAAFAGDFPGGVAANLITNTAAGTGTSVLTFRQTSGTTVVSAAQITDGATRKIGVAFTNNNGSQQFTNSANTFSGGITLLNNSTNGTRMQVAAVPVNTFDAGILTASPYGVGPITVGQTATDRAGIFVNAANATIANPIVANTTLGTDRVGTFRIDVTGLTLSGQVTAGASDLALSTNGTGTVTLTGRLTGNNGLRLLSHNLGGTSLTVTLANAAGTNDYAGNTTINDNAQTGRTYALELGASDQIPNGAGKGNVVINTNGTGTGTLRLQGFSDTINGLSGTGGVATTVAGASVLTLGDNDATASFSGTITESVGTIRLVKIGTGTQTLSGLSTYSGGTAVNAGTLEIGVAGSQTASAVGVNRAVSVAAGATLRMTQTDGLGFYGANPSTLLIGGTMTIVAGRHASVGNFGLTLDGGTITSEGVGDADGNYIFDGSVTTLANAVSSVIGANSIKLRNGSGLANQAVRFDVADGAAASDLSVGSVLTNGNGANGLTKTGNGVMTLSGTNTYTGVTTINGGVLSVTTIGNGGVAGNLGQASGLAANLVLGGGTLRYAGVTASTDRAFTLTASTDSAIEVVDAGTTLTFAGASAPTTGALTKRGDGTLVLGGANAHGGGTVVAAGTLRVANVTALGTAAGAVSVSAGATLDLNGTTLASANALTLSGAGVAGGGALLNSGASAATYAGLVTLGATSSIVARSGDIILTNTGTITGAGSGLTVDGANNTTVAGILATGAGALTKNGAGTLTLGGANTYSGGTTLNAGTLNINTSSALGTGAFVLNGGRLDNTGAADVVLTTDNVQAWNADVVFAGTRSLDLGAGAVTLGADRQVTVGASRLTIGGAIGGAYGLTKSGAGVLELGGAATYSGATVVNAGTLRLTGSAGINGSSALTVDGANAAFVLNSTTALSVPVTLTQGSVGGVGSIGSLTVADRAANAVGVSAVGTLSVGSLEFAGAGTVNVAADGAAAGLLQLGTLKVAAGKALTLNVTDVPVGGWVTDDYVLISYGALDGADLGGFLLGSVAGSTSRTNSTLLTDAVAKTVSLRIESYVPAWTGADGGSWVAGTTGPNGNWKLPTKPGAPVTDYISGDAVRFDDTAASGIVTIADADVTPASVVFDHGLTLEYLLSGTKGIAGAGGLTKRGAGTLKIATPNSYSGATVIQGGALLVQAGGTLGASTASLTLSGGRLDVGASSPTVGAVTITSAAADGSPTISASGDGSLTSSVSYAVGNELGEVVVSASLRGSAGLTKTGAGTLVLGGANTYAGATVVNGGLLRLAGQGSLGGDAALTLGGGRIDLAGLSATVGAVSVTAPAGSGDTISNGTLTAASYAVSNGTGTQVVLSAGLRSVAGGLTKTGAGALTLSGDNTYAGGTFLNAGTLNINGATSLGTGTLTLAGGTLDSTGGSDLTLTSNNVQSWNSDFVFTGTRSLNLGTGAVTLGASRLVTVGANSLTVGGPIGGAANGLTKAGAGDLILGGANTYGGQTTVSAGRLVLQSTYASASHVIEPGAVLELNATAGRDYAATTFGGAGTLRKTGTGGVFWGGAVATFALGSGSLIDVQAGSFTGGSNANDVWTANLSDLAVASGAVFSTVEANVRVNRITGTGRITTGFNGSGYASLTIGVDNGSSTFDGTIENGSSAGNLVKLGTGAITLTKASTLTGTVTISGGALVAAHADALATASSVAISSGVGAGTLRLATDTSVAAYRITTSSNNPGTIVSERATPGAGITHALGWLQLANNTYNFQAGANVTSGVAAVSFASVDLSAGSGGTATLNPTSARVTIVGGVSIQTNNSAKTLGLGGTAEGNLIQGVVANGLNTLSLAKSGAGSWELSGANTYGGATTISGGTLTLSGNRSGSSGTITVGNVTGTDATLNIAAGTFALGTNTITAGTAATGTINQSGGVVTFTGGDALVLGNAGTTASTGNYNLSAGSVTTNFAAASTTRGLLLGANTNARATFTLGGTGSLDLTGGGFRTTLQVGRHDADADGTVTRFLQTGGIAAIGNLSIGGSGETSADGSATLELTGGTFVAQGFSRLAEGNRNDNRIIIGGTATVTLPSFPTTRGTGSTATLYFDGGTLRPAAPSTAFLGGLTNAFVQAGGARFDTNGINITVSQALLADAVSAGGGLTKIGLGTLTLSGANTYAGMTTISAGTLQIGSGGTAGTLGVGDVANSGTLAFNRSNELSVSNVIAGSGALTKAGAGRLILTGANTYVGATTISGGTLQVGAGGTTGALGSGDVANSGTLAFNRSDDLSVGNVITGSGAVTKSGNGKLTLSGANTYSGATTITGGTLEAAAGALANTSGISVAGATLTAANYAASATLTLDAAATTTISGAGLTLSGAVTNEGTSDAALNFSASTGTITLASLSGAGKTRFGRDAVITGGVSSGVVIVVGSLNANISGGAVTAAAHSGSISGGTTNVSGVAAIGTLSGGVVNLNGATSSVGMLTAGTVNLGATALTVNSGTFTGLLAGAQGSLIKASAGTLTLSGANTFGGGTTINAGTLVIGQAGSLGSGAVTVASGASLDLANFSVSNVISAASGASIINGPSTASVTTTGSQSVDTVLTGTGGLTKSDGGELTLTTPNFFTGGVSATTAGAVISAAYLADGSSSLGASALNDPTKLVLGNGATLEFTGTTATTTSRSFTVSGSASLAVDASAAPLTFSAASVMALNPADSAPQLTLVAHNAGVNRFESQLSADDLAAGRGLSSLVINGTGQWVIGGAANRFKGDVRVDVGGGATLGFESGALGSGAGYADSVIEVGNGSKLAWSGANTDDISARLSVPAGATAKLDLGSNNVTFASAPTVGNGGSLEKQGTGTLNISAAVSAPTLNVAITGGRLAVNGTLGNITLASGATLGGSGTIGTATVAAGATVAPGNSPGLLTGVSLSYSGGANFEWEVQDATSLSGYDRISLSGNLDLTGASPGNRINLKIISRLGNGDGNTLGNPLNFAPPGGAASIRTFQFGQVGGVLLNDGQNISDVFAFDLSQFTYSDGSSSNAALWSIDWNSGTGAITLTAVPEPSTYGLGLGALALAAAALRRRRKQAPAA